MLPILRTITVGGVLLAFTVFVLALTPPDGSRAHLARIDAPARGPLIDRAAHPEWRQMLLLAAFHRAEELKALRELPDTPVRPPPPPTPVVESKADEKVAALPPRDHAKRGRPDAAASATSTIPVDIGEASSTELPVAPREEQPPVITLQQSREGSMPAPPAASKPVQHQALRQDNPDPPGDTGKLKPLKIIVPMQPAPEPVQRQAKRQDNPDTPPVDTGKFKPLKIIMPAQRAPEPVQRQAKRQDNSDTLPVSAVELKPLKIIVPAQPASGLAQRQAMRADKPHTPPAVAAKPPPVRAKPQATRAKPRERPHRAVRHHARSAKSAKTAAPPLDFFALLAASFLANAEHGPPNPITPPNK